MNKEQARREAYSILFPSGCEVSGDLAREYYRVLERIDQIDTPDDVLDKAIGKMIEDGYHEVDSEIEYLRSLKTKKEEPCLNSDCAECRAQRKRQEEGVNNGRTESQRMHTLESVVRRLEIMVRGNADRLAVPRGGELAALEEGSTDWCINRQAERITELEERIAKLEPKKKGKKR